MTQPIGPRILRGQIWARDVPGLGEKFFLVVSNNGRNASAYPRVHVVRTTAMRQPDMPSNVQLDNRDGGAWVKCDEVTLVDKGTFKRQVGVVSPAGMARVATGLKHILALP